MGPLTWWPPARPMRLPRASGDGPTGGQFQPLGREVAPRERGWARAVQLAARQQRGCPARAGMGPRWPAPRLPSVGLPRASGDGPAVHVFQSGVTMVAPRERGWARSDSRSRCSGVGCPARAGMGPARQVRAMLDERLPRASGDGPPTWSWTSSTPAVAPRERGWALAGKLLADVTPGCPARAGMGPVRRVLTERLAWLPRASGDGPVAWAFLVALRTVAPRERGWAH